VIRSTSGSHAVDWTVSADLDDDVEMIDRPELPALTNLSADFLEESTGSSPEGSEVCFGAVRHVPKTRWLSEEFI
jgi:hypothetical protein